MLFYFGTICFQDDESALNFVTSAANLRSHIFHIPGKSKFDVKCKCISSSVFSFFISHSTSFNYKCIMSYRQALLEKLGILSSYLISVLSMEHSH